MAATNVQVYSIGQLVKGKGPSTLRPSAITALVMDRTCLKTYVGTKTRVFDAYLAGPDGKMITVNLPFMCQVDASVRQASRPHLSNTFLHLSRLSFMAMQLLRMTRSAQTLSLCCTMGC